MYCRWEREIVESVYFDGTVFPLSGGTMEIYSLVGREGRGIGEKYGGEASSISVEWFGSKLELGSTLLQEN